MGAVKESAYIPGTCNINSEEIAQRRKLGHIFLVVSVLALLALVLLKMDSWYRLLLFPIYAIALSCYQQARSKFCVSYGSSGIQNADEGSKSASNIQSERFKKLDQDKARKMNTLSVLGGVLIALVTLLIPEA